MENKKMLIILSGIIIITAVSLVILFTNNNTNQENNNQNILINLSKFCDLNDVRLNYSPFVITECDYNNKKVYAIGYGAIDYPDSYFDSNKNFLFESGGMPLPDPNLSSIVSGINCENGRVYKCK